MKLFFFSPQQAQSPPFSPDEIEVLLAEHDWNDDDDGQVRAALDRTEVHPRRGERGGQERDYDFALLRLKVGQM